MKTKAKSFTITATLNFTVSLEIEAATEGAARKKAMNLLEKCSLDCPEVDVTECPDIDITDVEE